MTPQQAYEKRYGISWYDAKAGAKDLWMVAWTIAWAMAEAMEREACAKVCENIYTGEEGCGDWPTPEMCADAIRARDRNA